MLYRSSEVPSSQICWFLHSCIYYYNLPFLFVSLDSMTSMTRKHAYVWGCFPLMVTMFVKLALCPCNFNVTSNIIMVQVPSIFDTVLKPIDIRLKLKIILTLSKWLMISLFRNTQPDVFFNKCSENFHQVYCKASAVELRFWIVYYHATFLLRNKWFFRILSKQIYWRTHIDILLSCCSLDCKILICSFLNGV